MTPMPSSWLHRPLPRRQWLAMLGGALGGAAAVSVVARSAGAQEATRNTTGAPMNQGAYEPVRLPPKPNAKPLLTDAQRDELEHHLHCQCGCGLDVYTCRTTDFSCSVSPAMHADVMGLVVGGYAAQEIMAAFRRVYGERVLMAPVKEGFNWVGYIAPFAVLVAGAGVVVTLLKRWTQPKMATVSGAGAPVAIDATPDELARLRDALRDDE
jgi:cytochrome c-type biogenesis protein CcmH